MKTVLVTGGAGYIGSHCCKYLSEKGYIPIVYDNFVSGHREFVQWGPLEEGSIGDKDKLVSVLEKYQPVAVMHFAAYASVGESVTQPSKYYSNNVADTITLLNTMVECEVRNFIFSSSCAIYGYPENVPMDETELKKPINPYGKTKLMVEQILKDYDKAYNLKSVCLRYFNAAGADPDDNIGEDHDPETHLIPLVLDVALGRKEYITINGDDYNTPDGTCIRDYIHVNDLANAHEKALQHLLVHKYPLWLNLGNGQGYSVKEVIETVKKVTGKEITVKIGPRRKGDPHKLVASSAKASKLIDWKPNYTSLEDIVSSAWEWHQKRFNQKNIDV